MVVTPGKIKARQNRLSPADHHMLLALITADRSPDPNTQVGACVVDKDGRVIGVGYNSTPRHVPVDSIPWEREGELKDTKYPFIVHAEKNAIYNSANMSCLKDATIYVTLAPCHECAKDIIQAGISKVIFLEDKYHDGWSHVLSRQMLKQAFVSLEEHKWDDKSYRDLASSLTI